MDKFKKKIQEQAKSTQGTRTDLTSSPNGEKVKSTHTDKELAKMAGVGTGTRIVECAVYLLLIISCINDYFAYKSVLKHG